LNPARQGTGAQSTQGPAPTNALYQALTQPVGSDLMQRMLNSSNAQALGGAVKQNDQLRDQAAASGFGVSNPALQGQQQANTTNARGQVAQNNLTQPLNASQLNAQYGLGLGQLGALTQQNQAAEQLG